jgi:hypothetical protein
MENMINAKQAAQILDCTPDDVLTRRQRGEIKGFRHNTRYWRFRRGDVDRLAKRKGSPSAETAEQGEKVAVTKQACSYSGPGDTYDYLGLVSKGTKVNVIEEEGSWCRVSLPTLGEPQIWIRKFCTSLTAW